MPFAQSLALDGHGVVYYREQEVVDALVDFVQQVWGLSVEPEEAKRVYLSLQERTFAEEISYEAMLKKFAAYLELAGEDPARKLRDLVQRFSAAITIDPALLQVLHRLRAQGITVGMVTNSIHPASVKLGWLREKGVDDLFDLVVSSVDEGCKKPAPEIFRRFALRVSLPSEHIVFVGHDVQEVAGAKEAGMITVCLRCFCPEADYAVRSLGEVLDLPLWPMGEQKEA